MPHFACTKILFQTCCTYWSSLAHSCSVLIRKFSFLSKLLSGTKETISRRVFSSLAMENIYETSIVQQCRMLEANLGTCVSRNAYQILKVHLTSLEETKKHILNSDFKILLSSATQRCGSAAAAARVATHTSWRHLWDVALDQGVKGTRIMQAIFKELCRPSSCYQCSLCDSAVPSNSSCLEHACTNHPSEMVNLSYDHLISLLINADSAVSIFSSCKCVSYSSCFWTLKHSN